MLKPADPKKNKKQQPRSPPSRLLLRPPRPLYNVALRAQIVVSALVLFDPATGCYNFFTLTSDGAFH